MALAASSIFLFILAATQRWGLEAFLLAALLFALALLLLAPGLAEALTVRTLIGMAQSGARDDRRGAATGFGQVGRALPVRFSSVTLSHLVTLSTDREAMVRWQAVTSLGLVLAALSPTDRQIALRRAYQVARLDEDVPVRGAGARALGAGFASASDELAHEAWDALASMLKDAPEPLASVWLAELPRLGARNLAPQPDLIRVLGDYLGSREGTLAWATRKALRAMLSHFPREAREQLMEAALSPARGHDVSRAAETLWDLRSFADTLTPSDAENAAKVLCATARQAPDPVAGFALLCVGLFGRPHPPPTRTFVAALVDGVPTAAGSMAEASAALARGALAPRPPSSPPEVEALTAHAHLALGKAGDDQVETRRWARAAFEVAFMALPSDSQPPLLRALAALIANPDARLRTGSSAAIVDCAPRIAPAHHGALLDALLPMLSSSEEIVQRQTLVTLAGVAPHLATDLRVRVVTAVAALRASAVDLVRDEATDTLTVIREKTPSTLAA